ncbi:hypothetical protein Pyn_22269 [Prunus yedoensis var. nudiflora]|uniref:Uncharacterized protein n=1 Tax=Prunus yedoensis var. nudiflora TaxID=2094558 RepID=A0A314ZP95_PRUYE|nr:hypothetical protein Pyn_22269 [Prunus yedoensis var. nudiflora]
MGKASTHTDLATFLEIPIEKDPQRMITATHDRPPHTLSPIWRLSPRHNGSTLYDSYELRAVTHQLNKAIQASKASSPHYMYCFNSPFYTQGLSRVSKQNVETPKRILCQQQLSCAAATADKKPSTRPPRAASMGFVTRAWRKVKQGFLKNKPGNN